MALLSATFAVTTIKLLLAAVKLVQSDKLEDRGKAFSDLLENGSKLTKSISDLGLTGLAADLQRTADEADKAFNAEGTPDQRRDARALFDQFVPPAIPAPDRLVALGLQPAETVAEIRTTVLAHPQFAGAPLADALLTAILTPVLNRLLNDPAFMQKIEPALWRKTMGWQGRVEAGIDTQTVLLKQILAAVSPVLPLATAQAILADFQHDGTEQDPARIERILRDKALEYQSLKARLSELDNSGDLLDLAQGQIAAGQFDSADATLAKAEQTADVTRARIRSTRGDLAKLRVSYREAAGHYGKAAAIIAQIDPEAGLQYLNLKAQALYSQGLEFADLPAFEESIHEYQFRLLPRMDRLRTPLDWASVQNNLGLALQTLATRNADAASMAQAIAAYRAALEERTRASVPLDWAMTQVNLGNAFQALGDQQGSVEHLATAVAFYRAALDVFTQSAAPQDWSKTQNNLGAALWRLGELEPGGQSLNDAVIACRAALEEMTQQRVPLDWATAQNNLGLILAALGERENSPERLEQAYAALRAALQEWTEERAPLHWAITQFNLSNVEIAHFTLTADPAHLDRAEAHVQAAREVFVETQATHYIGMADAQLAQIAARRAGFTPPPPPNP